MRASRLRAAMAVAALLLAPTAAFADESEIELAAGEGRDAVRVNCVMCHSLDYITMNAPVMTPERWDASVRKMIDRMGAPVSDADAALIVQYLSRFYAAAEK